MSIWNSGCPLVIIDSMHVGVLCMAIMLADGTHPLRPRQHRTRQQTIRHSPKMEPAMTPKMINVVIHPALPPLWCCGGGGGGGGGERLSRSAGGMLCRSARASTMRGGLDAGRENRAKIPLAAMQEGR